MTIQEEVVVEAPAYVLVACNACRQNTETEISWTDLREADIGRLWCAHGGGEHQ